MGYEFDDDTAVQFGGESAGAGPGLWRATLTDRWHIGDKANGGYLLATVVRAMGATVAAVSGHPHPLTVTAHYFRPGDAGPAEIETEIVRTGRKLATATGTLSQGGKERIRAIGTFTDLDTAEGITNVRGAPPELPPVEACPDRVGHPEQPTNDFNIVAHLETRLHPDTGWIAGRPTGIAEVSAYLRFRDGRPVDVWALPLFADALPPAMFELLPDREWVPTIELTVHVRAVPAPGWVRVLNRTRFVTDGWFEEDGEIWDASGRLVAISRQIGMIFRP